MPHRRVDSAQRINTEVGGGAASLRRTCSAHIRQAAPGGERLVGESSGKETAHRKHGICSVINKLENAKTLKSHHVCAVCVKGSQHPVVGANCTKCCSARELTEGEQ